jgi:Tetratricopeptide repeat
VRLLKQTGLFLKQQGRYEEAERLVRQALEVSEQVLGEEHPDTLDTRKHFGDLLRIKG